MARDESSRTDGRQITLGSNSSRPLVGSAAAWMAGQDQAAERFSAADALPLVWR
jgi:hypothetical protein